MPDTVQLTFRDVEIGEKQARVKALHAELDRRLKFVGNAIDRHTFAAINDKSYSYMGGVLNTNNEEAAKPFQISFIPAEIIESPELFMKEVVNFLTDLCGYEPSPGKKSKLTPEQELKALKDKIKNHGLEKLFEV